MTTANLAYLSQADGETRTPDPFITSEVSCPTGSTQVHAAASVDRRCPPLTAPVRQQQRPQDAPTRGYFAIGIEHGKTAENLGGLWRCAHAFGAAFLFTIGARYPKQATDTTKAWKHIPLMEYDDLEAFTAALPRECEVIGVDCDNGKPRPLPSFRHPERAVYVLGAEDRGLSADMLTRVDRLVEIPTNYCLNVATAGGILMYDRAVKAA